MLKNRKWRSVGLASLVFWLTGLAIVGLASMGSSGFLWGLLALPVVAASTAAYSFVPEAHRPLRSRAGVAGLAVGALWLEVVGAWLIVESASALEGLCVLLVLGAIGAAARLTWNRIRRLASSHAPPSTSTRRATGDIGQVVASVFCGVVALIGVWAVLVATAQWQPPDALGWLLPWSYGLALGLIGSAAYATAGNRTVGDAIFISTLGTGVVACLLYTLLVIGLAADVTPVGAALAAPFVLAWSALVVGVMVGLPAIVGSFVTLFAARLLRRLVRLA